MTRFQEKAVNMPLINSHVKQHVISPQETGLEYTLELYNRLIIFCHTIKMSQVLSVHS